MEGTIEGINNRLTNSVVDRTKDSKLDRSNNEKEKGINICITEGELDRSTYGNKDRLKDCEDKGKVISKVDRIKDRIFKG